jgi:hypothetical protein
MTITTVTIAPASLQSLPIFLGAILIPLVNQLGHVGERVSDMVRGDNRAIEWHYVPKDTERNKTNSDDDQKGQIPTKAMR